MKLQESGMGSTLTPQDYWDIAVRRKWLVLGSLVVALSVSWTLCLVLPKSYRSSTLILVENQKIPERYVQGMVEGSVQERLSLIQQQVMSRTLLSGVIEEFKLYPEEVRQQPLEAVIETMRKQIKVDIKGGGQARVEAFLISFAHEDPMIARNVTTKLASQFIEENLKIREQFVEGAADFLDHELAMAKTELERQEQQISEFKQKYMGQLPGQLEANLRALDRLQSESVTGQELLNTLHERLALLEKAISQYKTTGMTVPGLADGSEQRTSDTLLTRLKELERPLGALSAEYKDSYPDVIHMKQEIEQVKAQLAERQELTQEDKAKAVGAESTSARRGLDPYLDGLVKQRDEIGLEIRTLKERHRRIMAQMKEYENRVETAPAREQELTLLVRDYDNTQKNYQSLLDKRLNARVAENLEKRQKGEQFRVLDPANLPGTPEKPDRLRIMLVGLMLGCGVGYGGALAFEFLNPSFRRPEDAEEALGCPVLAAIPDFRLGYAKGMEGKSAGTSESGQKARGGLLRLKGKLGHGKSRKDRRAARSFPRELTLVTKWSPLSVVAEQFRVAATRLASMRTEPGCTVVVMTSAVKGEGKSSTTANLGYVLAQDLGKMTVLIDGDLKNPTVHSYIEVPAEPGLTDLLCGHRGDRSLEHYLQRVGDLPLWILPTGRKLDKALELSKIQNLSVIISELRNKFEYIIVDAPPILPLADMNVLVGMADVLAMVVRAGATPRDVVKKALKTLRPAGQIGIMLNGLWMDSVPYYLRDYYSAQQEQATRTGQT